MKDWHEALAFALALPGVELGRHYGHEAAKVSANGRAFLSPGHEATESFCLQLDTDTIALLLETDPDSFFQTPHYAGYGAVLVRYGSDDPERVAAMIERARDQAAAKRPVRPKR